VMVNAFFYSVFGQGRGNKHRHNPKIAAYRNRWLAALFQPGKIEAVVALGSLAESAWEDFVASPEGSGVQVAFRRITHPTQPEAVGGSAVAHTAAIEAMLMNWNDALSALHPLPHRDTQRNLVRYGSGFKANEKRPIPEEDTPPWAPDWMRLDDGWADRPGKGLAKRRQILVTVPRLQVP
jgi:hypothetical protein